MNSQRAAFLRWLEAETIGTNHATSMKHTSVAHNTIVIDDGITVYLCIRADLRVPAYRDMRMKDTAFAYLHTFGNCNERTNVTVLTYLCRRMDVSKFAPQWACRSTWPTNWA